MNAQDIILKPVLTEKSYKGFANKKYVFKVNPAADRTMVKNAIQELFEVQVEKVNIMNVDGKLKRQGRTQGYTPETKRATVKLTADSKGIEFFEGMAQ